MPTTDIVGLAGVALGIAALGMALGRLTGLGRVWLVVLGTVCTALSLIPIAKLPLAASLRGVTGDLSVTTLLLLGRFVLRPVLDWEPLEARAGRALRLTMTAGGILLYPLALGLGLWDPYTLGYGKPWFLGGLAILAAAWLFLDFPQLAGGLALGVLAWGLGLLESRNLWDYLLDPFVFAWGFWALLIWSGKALGFKNRAGSSS